MVPTAKQQAAFDKILEGTPASVAMREVGFSENTAKNPSDLTDSKGFAMLMDAAGLSDLHLAAGHSHLLNTYKIEHMTFPLGPKGDDHPTLSGSKPDMGGPGEDLPPVELEGQPHGGALMRKHEVHERTTLTDQEIVDMLAEVGCKVKRIVHGESARHVYFWTRDAKSLKDALDMAYKLKGKYGEATPPPATTTNVFIAQPQVRIAVANLDAAMKVALTAPHVQPPQTP